MVYVQDDQGLTHAYMHLANTQPGLKAGDRVAVAHPWPRWASGVPRAARTCTTRSARTPATGDPLNQLIDPRPYVAGQRQQAGQPLNLVLRPRLDCQAAALSQRNGGRGQQTSGAAAASGWGAEARKRLQAVLVTEGGLTGARGDNGASAGPLVPRGGGCGATQRLCAGHEPQPGAGGAGHRPEIPGAPWPGVVLPGQPGPGRGSSTVSAAI